MIAHRAGLAQRRLGGAHVGVGAQGLVDELGQLRVIEALPPAAQVGRTGPRGRRRLCPRLGHGDVGVLAVRGRVVRRFARVIVALVLALERWGRGNARHHDAQASGAPVARLRGARGALVAAWCGLAPLLGFFLPAGVLGWRVWMHRARASKEQAGSDD